MRRKDREKDASFALEVIKDCEYATLATVNPDGTPYCIPISPVLKGNIIYFHCALSGKKLENIAGNSAVCISGVRHTKLVPAKFTTEFESVVAFGNCTMVTDDTEKIMALRLICEKYAAENLGEFENAITRSLARTGIGKIEITSITGKAKIYKQ
jgi:Predicted flavin-nucleotide-binding protein